MDLRIPPVQRQDGPELGDGDLPSAGRHAEPVGRVGGGCEVGMSHDVEIRLRSITKNRRNGDRLRRGIRSIDGIPRRRSEIRRGHLEEVGQ